MATKPVLSVVVSANLDELRAKLKEGEASIFTTKANLASMGNAFDGSKIVSQAGAMVQAVENVGGVSKLTAVEQAKLNGVLDQAITKYQLLGKEAPPHMIALRDQTMQVESAWDKANSALGVFGLSLGALSVAGIATSLLAGGKSAVEFGSHLSDLRDQTGLTLDELQRLNYAGATVGLGIDQIAGAVNKLQKNLVTDGGGVSAALHKVNLDLDDIVKMSPGQMFETMSAAIAKLPNPTERTAVAMQLLGKSGAELLPLMLAKVQELGDAAPIMSDDTIEALDRFDDAWATSKIKLEAWIGNAIGQLSSFRGFLEAGNLGVVGEYFGQAQHGAEDVSKSLETMAGTLDKKAGPSLRDLLPPLHDTNEAMKLLAESGKEDEERHKQIAAAAEAHRKAIQTLADTYTGKAIAKQVETLSEALQVAEKQDGLTTYQYQQLGKQLVELKRQGAALPAALEDIWRDQMKLEWATKESDKALLNFSATSKQLPFAMVGGIRSVADMTAEFNNHMVKGNDVAKMLKDLGPIIRDLPAPPKDPWEDFRKTAASVLDEVEHRVADDVVSLIGHWSHHKSVTLAIWDDIKGGISSVLSDILADFEGRFIKGLIGSVLGHQGAMSSAFAGLFSGAGGGGSAAAAAGAGAAGGGGAAAAAGAGGTGSAAAAAGGGLGAAAALAGAAALPVLLYKLQPMGPSEQESREAYRAAHMDTIGAVWNTDAGRQAVADYNAHPENYPIVPAMAGGSAGGGYYNEKGEFVPVPGYKDGTDGYVNFGFGTLAMLHGREKVTPEGRDSGGSGGVVLNVTVHAPNSMFTDRNGMRQLGEELLPYIARAADSFRLTKV